jgi:hypothetical protein
LTRISNGEEARAAWKASLVNETPTAANCHDYAEFCLFIGNEEEYYRVRQILFSTFTMNPEQLLAEKTAKTCSLRTGSDAELHQVTRSVSEAVSEGLKYPEVTLFPLTSRSWFAL